MPHKTGKTPIPEDQPFKIPTEMRLPVKYWWATLVLAFLAGAGVLQQQLKWAWEDKRWEHLQKEMDGVVRGDELDSYSRETKLLNPKLDLIMPKFSDIRRPDYGTAGDEQKSLAQVRAAASQ